MTRSANATGGTPASTAANPQVLGVAEHNPFVSVAPAAPSPARPPDTFATLGRQEATLSRDCSDVAGTVQLAPASTPEELWSNPTEAGRSSEARTLFPSGAVDLATYTLPPELLPEVVGAYARKAPNLLLQASVWQARNPELAALTPEELMALQQYTVRDFKELNSILRSGEARPLGAVEMKVKAISSGLNKLPSYVGRVLRGATLTSSQIEAYVPGTVVTERAFMSTAIPAPEDEGKSSVGSSRSRVEFVIDARRNGHDISRSSRFQREREVLFTPGTQFHVLSNELDEKTGLTTIHLAEVVDGAGHS